MSDAPEYLICLNCETPCYIFDWEGGVLTSVFCEACANDDIDQFMSEEDFESLTSADH